ncbi:GNAT family N-acetyltransferase [Saccharothrix coeruleofusca]|uniref:N-acetyltransferase domain-containing protein n=1 Tax=Saccharothrix coeruleofusca TaxID=33919 RepID=A0A918AUP8_9PSEU|nr:GNAT family N-acetyltransferase [Saccharothrix coeruleofusca]GGP86461.1 hypothetical protein GCM10010185_70220 [Saccharothrix coeruleofusca]
MPGSSQPTLTELVRLWERGWRECRGWAAPEEARGGLRLLLDQPGRHSEVIALHDDDATVLGLADEVAAAERPTWLTVPTTRPDEVERTLRDAGVRPRETREWLMTRDLADHPTRAVPAPYRVTTTARGPVIGVEVRHGDDLAAGGQTSVVAGHTVPDRIETRPGHRRRGLGAAVMGALAGEAARRGAHTGVLVASPDGRALYTSLGWTAAAAVVIATAA